MDIILEKKVFGGITVKKQQRSIKRRFIHYPKEVKQLEDKTIEKIKDKQLCQKFIYQEEVLIYTIMRVKIKGK